MKADQLPPNIEIGEGRTLRFFTFNGDDVVGAIETHPSARATSLHAQGEECAGVLHFDVPEIPTGWRVANMPLWTVEKWDSLTISPSVLCTLCGNHGFIRDGKWVPT